MSQAGALIDEQVSSDVAECSTVAVAPAVRRSDLLRGGLCIIDQGVVSVAGFATSLIIGRAGSREELGLYYLALTLVLLARGVQEQLVSAPYVVFSSRRRGSGEALYAGSSLLHQTAISALAWVCVLALLLAHSLGFGPAGLASTYAVLLLALPCLLLREYSRQFAFARMQVGTALTLDLTVTFVQIAGLALLAWGHAVTVAAAYAVLGLAGACGLLAAWARHRPELRFSRAAAWFDWQKNWSFGRWALAGHLVGSATAWLMPWILTLSAGEAATGLLAACATLVGLANTFITGVSNYLSPQAARAFADGGTEHLKRVLLKAVVVYSSVLACFCAVTAFVGDDLLSLAYGGRYSNSGSIVPVLAFNLWIGSVGVVAGNGLWAMNHPRANFLADGCLLVVSMIGALLLMPSLGTLGAAVAMLLGSAAGTSVRVLTLFRWMSIEGRASFASGGK